MKNESITQKIINGLYEAAIELEKFQVQVALGKAEAKDIYNEQKKHFADYIHSVKEDLHKSSVNIKQESVRVKDLLEKITVQLSALKTETKEAFEEQKKNLMDLLAELENYIRSNKTLNIMYSDLLHEIEVFKLKLEIIRHQLDLKKSIVKAEFEKNKKAFNDTLNVLREKMKGDQTVQEKWESFQTEMSEAYSHMKKAFTV